MAQPRGKGRQQVGGAPPLGWRRIAFFVVTALTAIGGVYLLAGSIEGFPRELRRLRSGDPAYLIAGGGLELLSILGYAALFWSLVTRDIPRVGLKAAVQIPLAGIAALRLLATGGAGGFALTAWALRQAGLTTRDVGTRMVAVLVVQYAFYLLALIVVGFGLWGGAFDGGGSFALTLLPAALSAAAIVGVGAFATTGVPAAAAPRGRVRRWLHELHHWVHGGVRSALAAVAPRRGELDRLVAVGGAFLYWAFDVAVLWCGFRAFGGAPPLAVVVMIYFLGTLGALLPLAGGVGGVEGGMIGVGIAFGVSPARAVLAVLAYRLISFWLPTLPGIAGYLGLRRTVSGWRGSG